MSASSTRWNRYYLLVVLLLMIYILGLKAISWKYPGPVRKDHKTQIK